MQNYSVVPRESANSVTLRMSACEVICPSHLPATLSLAHVALGDSFEDSRLKELCEKTFKADVKHVVKESSLRPKPTSLPSFAGKQSLRKECSHDSHSVRVTPDFRGKDQVARSAKELAARNRSEDDRLPTETDRMIWNFLKGGSPI